MKIERIERKEKDSIGHQVLVLVLAFLEAVITVFLAYYAVVVMDTTMVGRLMLTGLLVLAVLFWALEKGYLDYERVHALE